MKRANDVLSDLNRLIDEYALDDFIARGWVRPMRDETDYVFDDMDVARVRLVCELHIEMKFEFDAVDLILSLMDQLYEVKSRHDILAQALQQQPEDVRNAIIKNIVSD